MTIKVAIDGPAGAGKSTVAKQVALQLGVTYVDTGAIYRGLTWLALQQGIDVEDQGALIKLAETLELTFLPGVPVQRVLVFDNDVTEAIREPEISARVAKVAAYPGVRDRLLQIQWQLAEDRHGVVMDGRDIGTRIMPRAEVKFFLTATLAVRADRRAQELRQKGFEISLEEVQNELAARDAADQNRAAYPLQAAADAVLLDTSTLLISEVVAMIVALCQARLARKGGG